MRLKQLFAVSSCAAAIACGHTPTAVVSPTPVASVSTPVVQEAIPDFSGVWTGKWNESNCTHTGNDYYLAECFWSLRNSYSGLPFSFTFTQTDRTVTGTISIVLPSESAVVVSGEIDRQGQLVLEEDRLDDRMKMDGYVETTATHWTLRVDATAGLRGDVTISKIRVGRTAGELHRAGAILTSARTSRPTSFQQTGDDVSSSRRSSAPDIRPPPQ